MDSRLIYFNKWVSASTRSYRGFSSGRQNSRRVVSRLDAAEFRSGSRSLARAHYLYKAPVYLETNSSRASAFDILDAEIDAQELRSIAIESRRDFKHVKNLERIIRRKANKNSSSLVFIPCWLFDGQKLDRRGGGSLAPRDDFRRTKRQAPISHLVDTFIQTPR